MKKQFRKNLFCILAVASYVAGSCLESGILADSYYSSHLETLESLSSKAKDETVTNASEFTDISESDWYYTYIDELCSGGIIKGVSETSFAPQSTFSFAECCTVITRYLGLENEAENRQRILAENSKAGHAEWYSGYIQLLYEMGVLQENTGLFTADSNGLCDIDTSVATSPVKRYEFANMISRSFELSESPIKANNNYYEISGNASEFISSGFYSESIVQSYADVISDFESIPDTYRDGVLKAYSNGIFCGDQFGAFNPQNNLTRAEMAKVIAVTTNLSLRTWAENSNGVSFLSDSDYETDVLGNKFIKKSSAKQILECVSNDISVSNGNLSYTRQYITPVGYCADIYVYSSNEGKPSKLIGENSLHTALKSAGKDIFCWYGDSGKVLIVLRNLNQSSRPEAVMEMKLSSNEVTDTSFATYSPLPFEITANI